MTTVKPAIEFPWPIPLGAVFLIADAEGLRLKAYRCPAGVLTCGWGETDGVASTTVWTKEYADQRLCSSLQERAEQVRTLCGVHAPTDNELGAMVSLAYNIGVQGFTNSTVLRAHKAGDHQAASRAFCLWDKARINGVLRTLNGLTARRAAEAALYLTPEEGEGNYKMPQAVSEEKLMKESTIATTGAVSIGTGAVAILGQLGEYATSAGTSVRSVKDFLVDAIGIPSSWFFPIILIVIGAVVIYRRVEQRKQGWA